MRAVHRALWGSSWIPCEHHNPASSIHPKPAPGKGISLTLGCSHSAWHAPSTHTHVFPWPANPSWEHVLRLAEQTAAGTSSAVSGASWKRDSKREAIKSEQQRMGREWEHVHRKDRRYKDRKLWEWLVVSCNDAAATTRVSWGGDEQQHRMCKTPTLSHPSSWAVVALELTRVTRRMGQQQKSIHVRIWKSCVFCTRFFVKHVPSTGGISKDCRPHPLLWGKSWSHSPTGRIAQLPGWAAPEFQSIQPKHIQKGEEKTHFHLETNHHLPPPVSRFCALKYVPEWANPALLSFLRNKIFKLLTIFALF